MGGRTGSRCCITSAKARRWSRCEFAADAVPTISPVIPPASFYERELREMFGVQVDGLPDATHLYLPDDWEEREGGVYPLRKDAVISEGQADDSP